MKYLVILISAAFLFACSENNETTTEENMDHANHEHSHEGHDHGDKSKWDLGDGKYGLVAIEEAEAINSSELFETTLNNESPQNVKAKGEITKVCPSSQCWVMVKGDNDKEYLVKFKDEFSIPKDVVGKEIVFQGVSNQEEISVGELRADAMKAGMSEEEAEKITEPEMTVQVEAEGIIIK